MAKENSTGFGEHFLTTVGAHRIAKLLISESDRLTVASWGMVHIMSAGTNPVGEGRGKEWRKLEITVQNKTDHHAVGSRITVEFSGPESELLSPMTNSSTLFDQLTDWRWHDAAGEVLFLKKEIPLVFGDELSSDAIKLPSGCLALLDDALRNRQRHKEWFIAKNVNAQVVADMMSELKNADPLWALVLRMWLYSQGRFQFVNGWFNDSSASTAYDAALVMHMLADQETLPAVFEQIIPNSLGSTKFGGSLALGAICASVSNKYGLLCWYQCGFVRRRSEVSWEGWQKLAPSIKLCPPYIMACRLSLANRDSPRLPDGELMWRILQEMYLKDRKEAGAKR